MSQYGFTVYPAYPRVSFVYDWGHYCRAMGRQWTWTERVWSWNPCNHIGHLRGFE